MYPVPCPHHPLRFFALAVSLQQTSRDRRVLRAHRERQRTSLWRQSSESYPPNFQHHQQGSRSEVLRQPPCLGLFGGRAIWAVRCGGTDDQSWNHIIDRPGTYVCGRQLREPFRQVSMSRWRLLKSSSVFGNDSSLLPKVLPLPVQTALEGEWPYTWMVEVGSNARSAPGWLEFEEILVIIERVGRV